LILGKTLEPPTTERRDHVTRTAANADRPTLAKNVYADNQRGLEEPMTFVYTVNRVGRRVSVIAAGEMGVAAAGPFGTMLCQLAESEPTERIEIDLGGLMFMDSSGVAALNRAYRATSRNGCVLVVTKATGVVLRVLQLTGALAHLTPCAAADGTLPSASADSSRPSA
jgi:anti-sigma B factor antagonist